MKMFRSDEPLAVSAHAIDRYIERLGITASRESAKARLLRRLEGAQHIGGQHWYQSGLIFCIKNNTVVTVMKPKRRGIQNKVHRKAKR